MDEMSVSRAFSFGLSSIALAFHLATGVALFLLGRQRFGERPAAAAAIAYVVNPAAVFNTGLGLLDTVHSFWLVVAFGLAEAGRSRAGWIGAALAALTKPQTWGLMPLFLWRQLALLGWRKSIPGAAAAVITVGLVILPFLFHGTLLPLIQLPIHMGNIDALVSAQAHNLWWLTTMGHGLDVPTDTLLVGPISYHYGALGLLAASGFLVLWLAHGASEDRMLGLPAYQAFAWFCLTTRAHENHWFFVLPLTALALPTGRRTVQVFVVISVTGLANLVLHDPTILPYLKNVCSDRVLHAMELANCVANLTLLTLWTAWLIRTRRTEAGSNRIHRGLEARRDPA